MGATRTDCSSSLATPPILPSACRSQAQASRRSLDIWVDVDFSRVMTGWTYDGSINSIVFDADAIPEEGSYIEVSYFIQGPC